MNHVLVTVSRGIIEDVQFFDDPGKAVRAMSEYVRNINVEHNDAALYGPDGFIANAKHFLDAGDEYRENQSLIEDVSREGSKPLYIIANPNHPLGFMVASPDDPLAFQDPAEALSVLGQMRKDHGKHLNLYRVEHVTIPMAERKEVEEHNSDLEIEDFNYSLIEEYFF